MAGRLSLIKRYLQNNYWGVIIIILFFGFSFLLYYNSFNMPWEGDEGEYAYSAMLMRQGDVPYLNSFLQKPPLIIYTYQVAHLIKPFALWPPRLLAFLFTLATCTLLALIAKKIYGAKVGWAALWVSLPLLSLPHIDSLPANTEKFMLLPLVGLLALFIFKRDKENKFTYFFAGVLSILAIFYKPIALPSVIFIVCYWLAANWLKTKDLKKFFKSFGLIMFGAGISIFLILFYFIIHGALWPLWQQTFAYNLSYAVDTKNYFPASLFLFLGRLILGFWPIGIIMIGSFFYRSKLVLFWWACLLVSFLPIITTRIGHYYLLLAPFLTLIIAGTLGQFLKKIKIKERGQENVILVFIVTWIIIVFSSFMGEQFFLKPIEIPKWVYGRDNNFSEAILIADKVRRYTIPGDRIFIAGSEPQIYYFSQRSSVSKFDMVFPLSINTPWRDEYQRQAIEELKKNKPAAIIIPLAQNVLFEPGTPKAFSDFLLADLENNYHLVGGTVSDYQISTYLGPKWAEPDKVTDTSLLLYIKNKK